MLIKIGSAFIDPDEIAAITPERSDELNPYEASTQIRITLRNGGCIWIDATMDEAEAALIDAGVVENPYEDPVQPNGLPELDDEEVETLHELESDGYNYLARDKDGKLYAFRRKPEYDGAYWSDPTAGSGAPGVQRVSAALSCIGADDEEPTGIGWLLGYPF